VNCTYWAGAILGTLGELVLLNKLDPSLGWRIGFLIGPILGLVIIFIRRNLPESPRWQLMHGHAEEAERTIRQIEEEVEKAGPHCRRSTRARRWRSSRWNAPALSPWSGCCSRSTRPDQCSAPR
jgi:MFS family permease